jgi:hypothetical protein
MTRHSLKLTNLILSLPVAAGLLCTAPSASAQTSAGSSETATIPFGFSAGHVQAPAGIYQVVHLTNFSLSLRNTETEKAYLLAVYPKGGREVQTQGCLIFHRDGTEYSMVEVKIAGTAVYSEMTVQRKLQQATGKNSPLAGSTVEVAMK